MSITIPLVLMAIPLFDSSMAVLRRKLTGRSVFTVDRGHLHHNLMRHGFHDRALVGIIALLSSVTAAGAVAGVILKSDLISIATMVFALGSLVASKLFGFAELKMLYLRVERVVTSLISPPKRNMHGVHQEVVQLQGTRNWDTVWSTLVEFAEKHELAQLSLDLNMPWLHEGYHAAWKKNNLPEYSERWKLRLPLKHQGRIFGHLEFIGKQQEEETLPTIARLTELLDVMQTDLQALIQDFEEKRGTPRHLDDEVRSPIPGQPVPNL
jgi:UDP-GlcNAc:undecaprenyl-phosphate GlcNAc-1-phosphate transferase